MNSLFTRGKLIGIGAAALLGLLIVWYLLSPPATEEVLTTEGEETSVAEREVVDTLLQLRAVTLQGSILSEPAFLLLQDFGSQIIPEPVGRENPFAPLSSGVQATSSPRGENLFR